MSSFASEADSIFMFALVVLVIVANQVLPAIVILTSPLNRVNPLSVHSLQSLNHRLELVHWTSIMDLGAAARHECFELEIRVGQE